MRIELRISIRLQLTITKFLAVLHDMYKIRFLNLETASKLLYNTYFDNIYLNSLILIENS
jgi:hypothetical protein